MNRYTNPEAVGCLLEAEGCGEATKELERLIAKFQRKADREAEAREKELEAALGYKSEQEIQEAYGWEIITEKQYERYIDLFRRGRDALEDHVPTRTEVTLKILRRICKELMLERQEWEFCALTPEQQAAELARREQAKQAWKDHIQQIRDSIKTIPKDT